jgi:lysophospholipase L1-like esterase
MRLRNLFVTVPLFALLLISATRAADAPFAKEIRAFETADQKQPPPKDAVLFIGSSTIRFWKSLPSDFPDLKVINRGFGGSQISDSIRYADRIAIPYHPSHIVMYAGDNDLAAGKSPQQVLEDFQTFVKKIHASLPDVPITFISIKPSIARWKLIGKIREANALIEQYAKATKHVDFVDIGPALLGPDGKPRKELFRPDGLHMSPKGYAIVVALLKPRLEGKKE